MGAEIASAEKQDLEPLSAGTLPHTLYLGVDGTGVPMRPSELAGRVGKQPDGSAKTREVKLCTVWSTGSRDLQNRPMRDEGSVTYTAAIESAATLEMMALAPQTVQRIPDRLRRVPMTPLHAAATTPEPVQRPLSGYDGRRVQIQVRPRGVNVLTPQWLQIVAIVSLLTAACCASAIVFDILRGNRQHMWIMDVVWPITALWSGPLGLWAYYRFGRLSTHRNVEQAKIRGKDNPGKKKPYPQIVAIAATHCGAGCTLGDIIAEWIHFFAPLTIAGLAIFGAWVIDFAFAFTLGIAFQYFTIAPMRNLPLGKGLVQALKADTLSLTAWQIGMYGWMAIVRFVVFGKDIPKTDPSFWFLMQIGMAAGFLTSYPVNWWLVNKGIKERM